MVLFGAHIESDLLKHIFQKTKATLFVISRCDSGLVLGLNPCTTIWAFFVSPEELQNANMAILA